MKSLTSRLIIFLVCLSHHIALGQTYLKDTYPDVWQRAIEYTMEVAKAMPAEKYNFKPTDISMTFHEQMVHLVNNLGFLSGKITGNQVDFLKSAEPGELEKEEIISYLRKAFRHVSRLMEESDDTTVQEMIEFGGEEIPKENIFYLMRDHMTHHRAQAVLYLRMNGIEPPKYRGW